ncbi:MAG: anhydro-N-acetylmuramic acid kinase [Elusimicrobiota bacterium]
MNKKMNVLGLMSGTSADGLSMAYCEIEIEKKRLNTLAYSSRPYRYGLKEKIMNARKLSLAEISALNFELGRLWAQMSFSFLNKFRLPLPELVSSHGQTVFHDSSARHTLQIGEASFIAEKLKVPVVCDFRPQDMAAGGQGAPLVPFFDEFFYGAGEPTALLNIGGVANISLVGRDIRTRGFDTGPGNSLMDWAVSFYSRGKLGYDRGGKWASKGIIDFEKAEALLKSSFFKKAPPKSLDREEFGMEFFKKHFSNMKKEDALSTINYFTGLSVKKAVELFLKPAPARIIVSGGGALNPVLMKNLSSLMPEIKVISIASLGMHPLAKEPAAFALLGALAWLGRPNCPWMATGAEGERVLGKIVYPFGPRKL